MKPELMWLAWTAFMTVVLWLPYSLNRMQVWGVRDTVGYPDHPKLLAPWAERAKKAHYNAVENLVVFGALVLVAVAANKTDNATAMSAMVYFWARLAHYVMYVLGVPWLRTIAFTVGWLACVCIFWQIVH